VSGSLLVVDPNPLEARPLRDSLFAAGFDVLLAHSFEEATRVLAGHDISLLITCLRLERFNGLHLVLRTRATQPGIPAIMIGLPEDHSSDVDRMGVHYLTYPVDPAVLTARVTMLLGQGVAQRRWPRKPAHLPAYVSNDAAEVVELSYGGLRLESSALSPVVGHEIVVSIPSLGVTMAVVPRWTKSLGGPTSWCGVEIVDEASPTTAVWRGAVDRVH